MRTFHLLAATAVAAALVASSSASAQSEMDIRLINTLNALDKRLAAIERRLDTKSKHEADEAKAEVRQLKQQLGTRVAGRTVNGAGNAAYMADPGKGPPIIGRASQWAGAFASISAGNQWLNGKAREVDNETTNQTQSLFNAAGVLTNQTVASGTSNFFANREGDDSGVVFTGTFGYNVMVTDRVLVGWQSEYTHALQDVRLTGSGLNTNSQTSQAVVPAVGPVTTFNSSNAFFSETQLTNKWTASALGRLGVLVTPETQLYGLAGWSWGGFVHDDFQALVLNGPTFGAGIERDFGWIRGFVQGKAILYDAKSVTSPNNTTQTFTQSTGGGNTSVSTSTSTGSDRNKFSAHAYTFTAGVVVPIDFR
jgi:hypothetical protein